MVQCVKNFKVIYISPKLQPIFQDELLISDVLYKFIPCYGHYYKEGQSFFLKLECYK